jgi:hypothetical protein
MRTGHGHDGEKTGTTTAPFAEVGPPEIVTSNERRLFILPEPQDRRKPGRVTKNEVGLLQCFNRRR